MPKSRKRKSTTNKSFKTDKSINMEMNQQKFEKIKKSLNKLINDCSTFINGGSNYEIHKYKFTSDTILDKKTQQDLIQVLALSRQDDSADHGTAMFPIFNNNWCIGCYGSIWLDAVVNNNQYRIAFYNEKQPQIHLIML